MGVEISNICFILPSTQSEGKRIFFPQLNLLLPWTGFTNYIVHLNFCFIFFSLYTNMRVHALNCNILEIFNLWTKNFSYGRRSKHWYVQALLMAKRNEFNSNELVTILNIILPKVQYFFWWYIWKIGNIVLRRISSSWEKNNGNIQVGVENSVCPNRYVKKTYACRHPQMNSKKGQKTTMLHICRLEVKKSCC